MSKERFPSASEEEEIFLTELPLNGSSLNRGYHATSDENLKSRSSSPWMVPISAISTKNNVTPKCMKAIIIASTIIIIGLLILICLAIVILLNTMCQKEDISKIKEDISAVKQDTSILKELARFPVAANPESMKLTSAPTKDLEKDKVSSKPNINKSVNPQGRGWDLFGIYLGSPVPQINQDKKSNEGITSEETTFRSTSSPGRVTNPSQTAEIFNLKQTKCNLCRSICAVQPETVTSFGDKYQREDTRYSSTSPTPTKAMVGTSLADNAKNTKSSSAKVQTTTGVQDLGRKATPRSTQTTPSTKKLQGSRKPSPAIENNEDSQTTVGGQNPARTSTSTSEYSDSDATSTQKTTQSKKDVETTRLKTLVKKTSASNQDIASTKVIPFTDHQLDSSHSTLKQEVVENITISGQPLETTSVEKIPTQPIPEKRNSATSTESTPLAEETSAMIRAINTQTSEKVQNIITVGVDNNIVTGWYNASNGLYYKYRKDFQSYQAAAYNCQYLGGRLASTGIRDPVMKEVLHKLAPDVQFWIGLDKLKENGRWMWSDGVVTSEANIPWDVGQPNHAGGLFAQDCVEIEYNGRFNDDACMLPQPYLCEKER